MKESDRGYEDWKEFKEWIDSQIKKGERKLNEQYILQPQKATWWRKFFWQKCGNLWVKWIMYKHKLWFKKIDLQVKINQKGLKKCCVYCFLIHGETKTYLPFLYRRCPACKTKLIRTNVFNDLFRKEVNKRINDFGRNEFYSWNVKRLDFLLTQDQIERYLIKKRVCPKCNKEIASFRLGIEILYKCVNCDYERKL